MSDTTIVMPQARYEALLLDSAKLEMLAESIFDSARLNVYDGKLRFDIEPDVMRIIFPLRYACVLDRLANTGKTEAKTNE